MPEGSGEPVASEQKHQSAQRLEDLLTGMGKAAGIRIAEVIAETVKKATEEVVEDLSAEVQAIAERMAMVEHRLSNHEAELAKSVAWVDKQLAALSVSAREATASEGERKDGGFQAATAAETIRWIKSNIVFDERGAIDWQDFSARYDSYCRSIGKRPMGMAHVGRIIRNVADGRPLKSVYLGRSSGEKRWRWEGLRWKDERDERQA